MLAHFGVRCLSFQHARASFRLTDCPVTPNPNGSVHGGILAAIIDDAVGCVFMSVADGDVLPATASLTIDYLRPAFAPLRFDARVPSAGRSLIHCDVGVHGADGKLASRARAIMAVKQIRTPPTAPREAQ